VSIESNSKRLFDQIVEKAIAELTDDDRQTLKTLSKDEAQMRLHFTYGGQLRYSLKLWNPSSTDVLMAISEHSNQGILLGFNADGASNALIGHIWDRFA
jgi:hypothetical protein